MITKEITLPESVWNWIGEMVEVTNSSEEPLTDETFSSFIAHMVQKERYQELELNENWSNYAALGYLIAGAEALGYSKEAIVQLNLAVFEQFDDKTLEDAKQIFNTFTSSR